MALKRTTWRPDTCGCEIEYEWDDAVPADARDHRARRVSACPAHVDADLGNAFGKAMADNVKKNRAVAALLAHDPSLSPRDIGFAFDDQRTLRLSAPTLANPTAARAALTLAGIEAQID